MLIFVPALAVLKGSTNQGAELHTRSLKISTLVGRSKGAQGRGFRDRRYFDHTAASTTVEYPTNYSWGPIWLSERSITGRSYSGPNYPPKLSRCRRMVYACSWRSLPKQNRQSPLVLPGFACNADAKLEGCLLPALFANFCLILPLLIPKQIRKRDSAAQVHRSKLLFQVSSDAISAAL